MTRTRINTFLSTAIALLVLISCASAPVQEMSDARQAIYAAEDAGAENLSPVELSQARDALKRAVSQLKANEFGLARVNARTAWLRAVDARTNSIRIRGDRGTTR